MKDPKLDKALEKAKPVRSRRRPKRKKRRQGPFQEVLRALDRIKLKHRRGLMGLGLAGLVGFLLMVFIMPSSGEGDSSNVHGELTYKVTRGDLLVSFIERGNIRAAKSVQMYNQLEGVNTIVNLVPEGTYVKAGDLLVEMDSSDSTQLLNQLQIQVDTSEAAMSQAEEQLEIQKSLSQSDLQQAKVNLELAQIDLEKYKEGDFEVAQRKAEADKTIAEEELARAQNQCEWTEKLSAKGYVTGTELIADRLAVTKGRLQLDQADRALVVLKKYTAKKDLKKYELDLQLAKAALDRATLKANAEEVKAKADVTAKKSSLVHYRKRLQKLQDQLEKTRITAPQDGMVVYATTEAWRRERMIEKGAQVHENQLILSLPDVTSMAVDVEVHESWVDQVREGLPALISTDALPNLSLKGKVTKVGILPDSVNRVLNPDLKVYLTEITLDDAPEIKLIRPGMSAKVQVIINVVKEVLFVPVQSVTTVDRQQVCYLLQGEEFVPKPVRGGQYNESYIEIVSGLKDGDIVKLNAPAPQGGKQVKEEKEALELAKSIKSRLQDPPRRPTEAAESPDRKPKKKWSPKREKKESDDVPRPSEDTADPSSSNRPPADTGTTSDKTKTTRKITDEDEGAVAYPRARGRLRDDREAGEE